MNARNPEVFEIDLEVGHGTERVPIHCDVERPNGAPLGTLLIAHGFMGYKEYGMFPYLAQCAIGCGWTAIRFNFSHSGMTRTIATFEREDLFEKDTWDKQVVDLERLVGAVRTGELPHVDPTKPIVLLGHSRGGMAAILFAGRGGDVERVFTVAAGTDPLPVVLSDEAARTRLRAEGHVTATSSRTGQDLRIGREFIDSIEANPAAHDIPAMARSLGDRLMIVHGEADPTVDVASARLLGEASGTTPAVVPGADHVFNVRNPFPFDGQPSAQLAELADLLVEALASCPARSAST